MFVYSHSLSSRFELSPSRSPPSPHGLYLSSGSVLIFSFLALCARLSRAFPFSPRALRSPYSRFFPSSYALYALFSRFLLSFLGLFPSLHALCTSSLDVLRPLFLCSVFTPRSFGVVITLPTLLAFVTSRQALHSILLLHAFSVAPKYHLFHTFLQLPHRPISAYKPQLINITLTIPPS